MQYTDKYRSPLGEITLASDGDHLTGLWFDGQKYFAATLSAEHQERELPIFEQAKEWLDSYFMGKIPSFTPPIHLEEALRKAMEKKDKLAILTGVYTGGGEKVWVFYTRTVRVFGERLNEALAPFELLPISIYTEMDPDWEEYKDMYEMKEWAVD